MIVNCTDLGDPPVPDGTPYPISIEARGINKNGEIGGFVRARYDGKDRTVAACLFSSNGILSFGSPFGFTELWMPIDSIDDNSRLYFGAANGSGYTRAVVVDTNTSESVILPDLGKKAHHILPSYLGNSVAYAAYLSTNDNDSGAVAFEIPKMSIKKITVKGYHRLAVDCFSPNGVHMCCSAVKEGDQLLPIIGLIVNGGKVTEYPGIQFSFVDDSGFAIGSSQEVLVFIDKGTVREISLAKEMGRSVTPGGQRFFMNSQGLCAGTYSEGTGETFRTGGCVIWKDAVYDLMDMSSVRNLDLVAMTVEGLNQNNQIAITGLLSGEERINRAYRIDVDVNAMVSRSDIPSALEKRMPQSRHEF